MATAPLLAAAARQFPLLIAARALQGIGNATTLPSVMAIITRVFPDKERGRAMGFWATVNGAGHGISGQTGPGPRRVKRVVVVSLAIATACRDVSPPPWRIAV